MRAVKNSTRRLQIISRLQEPFAARFLQNQVSPAMPRQRPLSVVWEKSRGFERGEVEVKAGGFGVGDGSEKGEVGEASGDAFGELEFAVDGFYGSAGYPALEVAEDSQAKGAAQFGVLLAQLCPLFLLFGAAGPFGAEDGPSRFFEPSVFGTPMQQIGRTQAHHIGQNLFARATRERRETGARSKGTKEQSRRQPPAGVTARKGAHFLIDAHRTYLGHIPSWTGESYSRL